jgi:hypothetical protein
MHRSVVQHLKTRGAQKLLWWHTPNGMYAGGTRQGAIMKSLGMLAGVSDILALHEGMLCPSSDQLRQMGA